MLLTGPAAAPGLAAAYDPDVSWSRDGGLHEHRAEPAVDLHPDLAVLLSTSGTTGSPKLVRLSAANVLANAGAIVDYLGITAADVAPTVLPMHYCYGLSVVHSHLLVGASLLLTEDSVVDASFWDAASAHRITSLAGVPYTFELLDRVGFADMDLPHLRYVTQAGGRLAPEDVRRYARLGRERGWDLFVMYGQTEATARMAYLPPLLAETAPDHHRHPGRGRLVHDRAAAGAPVRRARRPRGRRARLPRAQRDAGLRGVARPTWRSAGPSPSCAPATSDTSARTGSSRSSGGAAASPRSSGCASTSTSVEKVLAARGVVAAAADGGDRLVLAVCSGAAPVDVAEVAELVRDELGLPPSGLRLVTPTEMPRLPNGKTDYRAVLALADAPEVPPTAEVDVVALVGGLLRRPDATADGHVRRARW